MSGLVFAAIAPHGSIAIPEARTEKERGKGEPTREAMEELRRRFEAAHPDVVVILTPHNVHVEGAMAVVEAGRAAGDLAQWGGSDVKLEATTDRRLAGRIKAAVRNAGIPMVGISYGGNNPDESLHPMDWAVLVPYWFMGGRSEPQVPLVIVSPARDLRPEDHVTAGRAMAKAARDSGRRVALVASCDQGHGHDASGPYGLREESKQFDDRVVEILHDDRLADLLAIPVDFVRRAAADSWWQMLMLHGALDSRWRGELLCYEAPTYFGMICAAYEPAEVAAVG
jgi:aromatic ring-opening dioxygenase LigB subunit